MPPKGSKMVRPSQPQMENGDPTRGLPLAYSTFSVPPPINAKSELTQNPSREEKGVYIFADLYSFLSLCIDISSQYLRTDNQTWLPKSFGNPASNLEAAKRELKRARLQSGDAYSEEESSDEVQSSDEEDEQGIKVCVYFDYMGDFFYLGTYYLAHSLLEQLFFVFFEYHRYPRWFKKFANWPFL